LSNSQSPIRRSNLGGFLGLPGLPGYVGFALIAAFAFAVRAVLARAGGEHLSLPHVLMMQSALSLPILVSMAKAKRTSLVPHRAKLGSYAWRVSAGVANMLLLLYALKVMPAALASALSYTAPLFTALLAPRLLKESTTPAIMAVTVIGFAGLTVAAAPYATTVPVICLGIGLLCGLAGAFMQMSMRKLAAAGEPGVRSVFWTQLAGLAVGLVCCVASGNLVFSRTELALGGLIALAQVTGQLSNSAAYAFGRALPVNAISFLTLPMTLVLAMLFLGEHVTLPVVLGLAITLPACFLLVWLEQAHLRALHDQKTSLTPDDIREEHTQIEEGVLGLGNEPLVVTEPCAEELTRLPAHAAVQDSADREAGYRATSNI
jgi:drug/metabolite transporter (DMT)-like permease